MSFGQFGFAYGAALDPYRRRVRYGQGANRFNFDVLVLGITDTTTPASKSTGGGAVGANVTDLVLPLPYAVGRRGQVVTAAGALSVQLPDGGLTGGNRRGAGAVDFQTSRSAATQVASGQFSVVFGVTNTASGARSVAIGNGNVVSAQDGIALGKSNTVSSSQYAAIGFDNSCTNGFAFGSGNTSSGGNSCVAVGASCTASGSGSFASGTSSTARGITGSWQFATGTRTALGDVQIRKLIHRKVTTDATVTTLTTNGGAEATSNTWVIPADYTGIFSGYVVARATAVAGGVAKNDSKGWKFEGMVTRDTAASTVALLGAVTPAAVGTEDASMAACALTVTVNTTNGSLIVQATGIAATSIAWHGWIDCAENG